MSSCLRLNCVTLSALYEERREKNIYRVSHNNVIICTFIHDIHMEREGESDTFTFGISNKWWSFTARKEVYRVNSKEAIYQQSKEAIYQQWIGSNPQIQH